LIVCICRGVSERVIRLAVAGGARSVEAVEAHCGAGGDCGSCRGTIEEMVEGGDGLARSAYAPCPRAAASTRVAVTQGT
jgi:bacterioferritin-associated ferredoxin